MSIVSGNADRIKQINRSEVLKTIHKYSPISKKAISTRIDLTFATVSNIVTELLESNVIKSVGYGESSGGRKPLLYEINWNHIYVIAVDIGVTKITTALINFRADIIYKHHHFYSNVSSSTLIESVYQSIDELLAKCPNQASKVMGIGVSAPGPINEGEILSPPNMKDTNIKIQELLEERYQLFTILERDANASAFAEQWFGNIVPNENILYVFADQGIGGGLIVNGRIYKGFYNGAGEIGHTSIDVDGPRCSCGKYGCLETMASGLSIIRRVKEEMRRGKSSSLETIFYENEEALTLDIIASHAMNGDKLAQNIMEEAGRYLGIGVANAINIFAPTKVITGGEIVDLYPSIIPIVEKVAKAYSFSQFAHEINFTKSTFGNRSRLIGAASVIQHQLFEDPVNTMNKREG